MDVAEEKSEKGMLPQHLCPEMLQMQEMYRKTQVSRAAEATEQLKVAF